ncbi:uncharacterized protein [Nicotiana sylvestris]|uniref:uncharacterized protein n=1 Tax=Nicotiana sylvestris TaxID=4096 RepID=UPI00388CA032
METICIIVAFNGRWTEDYKYLDHQTKLFLAPESIQFEDFVKQIFELIELDSEKFEILIWFDINLGTSKGMLVSKDLDLHTCIELLKTHSLFKSCRFIVDISERVFASTSNEHANTKTQHDNQERCQQIVEVDMVEAQPLNEEVHQTFDSIQVEGQSIIEIDNEQALGIQVLESAPVIEVVADKTCTQITKRRSNLKQKESPTTILRENASLDQIKVGSVFDKKKSIINCFSNVAIKGHFEFKVVRSSSTRYSLTCNDERCHWCVRAFRIKDSTLFKIVKLEKKHDCSVNTRKADQRHATPKLISGYIIDNLRDPRFEVTPAFVMAEMQKLHGLDIGYHKAWRAIQHASALIRGSPEENYELLCSYLYMMTSKNPGTYTNIKIDDNNRFLYMFYAYGSSIAGWNHCRPVIAIDATFLKSKYRGVLMISVSKDANNQIFPLAFGIAESENNNSYEWYFSQLRNAIGSRENLIFLSDRHQAIANGIVKVYPESHHGICIYHLEQNLKRRKVKSEVIKLFQSAARVYKRKEFDIYMSDIANVDKKTYDYLMEEPPERWARSCSPQRRYDMLTTNIVESMNSVLLEARELPILRMMDFIQVKLQHWFYERRNKAEGTFYDVSCWVFPVDSWRSRVEEEGITFLVDLNKRTCDCFQFQLDELPCIHAIAAIEKRNIKKSDFCSHWYLKESWLKTYERQIHPVGHTDSWIVPESVKSQIVKPPDFKVPPGRKQKKRHIPATEPSKITFKCGRCRRIGHNRTACIYSPALHPFSRKHREE